MDTETLRSALKQVNYPGYSRDILSFGLVKSIDADTDSGSVTVNIALSTADPSVPQQIEENVERVLKAQPGVKSVKVLIALSQPRAVPGAAGAKGSVTGPAQSPISGVKHIIAVASGKGGVGKSTFSTNLACAFDILLGQRGKKRSVGLMDCDIYGPSIPLMMGIAQEPEIEGEFLIPVENFGIRVMSMGLLVDENTPVVWRGPMVMKTIQQFAANVKWGELDVLIVDLPPGTGDAQLSLVQTLPLKGAVIVTTPQAAAFNVARRGALMFGKVNVPILGVAENMSYLIAPDGSKQFLFGQGGGEKVAESLQTELLGQVPLDPLIGLGSDHGIPIVVSAPESIASETFLSIARQLLDKIEA